MYIIVVYDVPAERTWVYRKLLRKQLTHLQQSVFVGELTDGQVTKLKQEIEDRLTSSDSVVIFESSNPSTFDYTTYGEAEDPSSRFT